jgi:hypothetical protein
MIDINLGESFYKDERVHPFWAQNKRRILEELNVEPADEKLK